MDDRLRFMLVLALLHTATLFVLWGAFSLAFRRGWFRRFQVAEGKAPSAELAGPANREVILGQPIFALLLYVVVYPLWRAMGGQMVGPASVWQVVWQLPVFILCEDTIFYWSHRLLHVRFLFRHVHARHHRFRHVRSLAAEFAHPLEGAMNFVAFFLGPVLLASPFGVICIWVVVRMFETVEAHSGYAFTGSSSRHSFHHLHAQRGCYGSFISPWEILMGTDRQWKSWRASGKDRPLKA